MSLWEPSSFKPHRNMPASVVTCVHVCVPLLLHQRLLTTVTYTQTLSPSALQESLQLPRSYIRNSSLTAKPGCLKCAWLVLAGVINAHCQPPISPVQVCLPTTGHPPPPKTLRASLGRGILLPPPLVRLHTG